MMITILGLAWFLASCSPTKEKINELAGYQNGEPQIADILFDASVELPVRVYALVKLIKLKQTDLVFETLKKLPKNEALTIIATGAQDIADLLKEPDVEVQAAAKDVFFMFRTAQVEAVAEAAKKVVLNWYATDFLKKYDMGKFGAFTVLTEMGVDATPLLLKLLDDRETWKKVGKIIQTINHEKLTEFAGRKLTDVWNAEYPNLSEDLLNLLASVRDDKLEESLTKYVLDIEKPWAIRRRCINALTYNPRPISLPMAIKMLRDKKENPDIRGLSLDIIKQVGGLDEQATLTALYPALMDEDVMWGTMEAILVITKGEAVAKVIQGMNPKGRYHMKDYVQAHRYMKKNLTDKQAEQLRPLLKSKQVHEVILAAIALQYAGNKDDAETQIKPLLEDKREMKGYKDGVKMTVGIYVKTIYDKMKQG